MTAERITKEPKRDTWSRIRRHSHRESRPLQIMFTTRGLSLASTLQLRQELAATGCLDLWATKTMMLKLVAIFSAETYVQQHFRLQILNEEKQFLLFWITVEWMLFLLYFYVQCCSSL